MIIKYLKNIRVNKTANFSPRIRMFLSASFPELSEFPTSIDSYKKLHKYSIENNEHFWGTLAKSRLEWSKQFDKVCNNSKFSDLENFDMKWFINGKLNVSGTIH